MFVLEDWECSRFLKIVVVEKALNNDSVIIRLVLFLVHKIADILTAHKDAVLENPMFELSSLFSCVSDSNAVTISLLIFLVLPCGGAKVRVLAIKVVVSLFIFFE
jgi:hypothetical protein